MARVAVVGAGAVGCYYGMRLAEAGHDVRFLMRRDYQAVRGGGLHLSSPLGDLSLAHPTIADSPQALAAHGEVDWLLIGLKATGLADLPSLAGPLLSLSEGTRAIAIMNGLTVDAEVASLLPGHEVFGGMGFIGVARGEPGQVRHQEFGALNLGHHGDDPAQLGDAVALFDGSKVEIRPEPSLLQARWEKLGWNIPFNGLCVIAGGVATDRIMGDPSLRQAAARTMSEVFAAGNADLASVGAPSRIDAAEVSNRYLTMTADMAPYLPSTTLDFIEGRQMESEAMFQAPAERARELGVECPLMELFAGLVSSLDAAR